MSEQDEAKHLEDLSQWDGKKSICNKFPESSPVTSIVWPAKHPYEVVYGLYEGKVKIGNLRTNKSQALYTSETCVVALACHPDGTGFLSSHGDGSIYRFKFPSTTIGGAANCIKIIQHSSVPCALTWGLQSICVGGNDQRAVFYDVNGNEEQSFIYDDARKTGGNHDVPMCKEFTVACSNPAGNSVVVGNFNSFYIFVWNSNNKQWEQTEIQVAAHMCSVTALTWEPNGAALVIGTSNGLIELYDAAYRRYLYKNAFEITYISPTQILVGNLDRVNSAPVLIQTSTGDEISNLRIYSDPETNLNRYLVAKTNESLILCDMDCTSKWLVSEIPWRQHGSGKEKFLFDTSNACIISYAGELSIVEVSILYEKRSPIPTIK